MKVAQTPQYMVAEKMKAMPDLEDGERYAIVENQTILFTSGSKLEIAQKIVANKRYYNRDFKWAVLHKRVS